MIRLKRSFCFTFLGVVFTLASCASPSRIALTDIHSVQPEERIVIGRVQVIEKQKSLEWSKKFLGPGTFEVAILPAGSSRALYYPLDGDGTFYWCLPPGEYAVAAFEWQSGIKRTGRIFAGFTIHRDEKPVYIGTLKIIFWGGRYSLFVLDEYDRAVNAFRENFPGTASMPAINLMELEARP